MKIVVTLSKREPTTVEYAAGLPVHEIAARHGVTAKTVRKRARLAGVAPRKVKVVGTKAKFVITLYRKGETRKKICELCGIDNKTLSLVLKRGGVAKRTESV